MEHQAMFNFVTGFAPVTGPGLPPVKAEGGAESLGAELPETPWTKRKMQFSQTHDSQLF